jgi:hypothetical protein
MHILLSTIVRILLEGASSGALGLLLMNRAFSVIGFTVKKGIKLPRQQILEQDLSMKDKLHAIF